MMAEEKIILDLCGGTGAWSKPYQENGYDVRIIDILQGRDVRSFHKLLEEVHGILAAPICTDFAGSGARWWKEKGEKPLLDSLSIVDACFRIIVVHNPVWWVLENPVGRLSKYLGKPRMYFNPCDYGDPYTKKTCLWGDFNVPKKCPVLPTEGSKIHKMPPSESRQALRSITPPGFAYAFYEANP
jgi:hypothetical protein